MMNTTNKTLFQRLMPGQRPGLMIRLSHLIVIQVLFIFLSLGFILFYPEPNNTADKELKGIHETATQLAELVRVATTEQAENTSSNAPAEKEFVQTCQSNPTIRYAQVYLDNGEQQHPGFIYIRDTLDDPLVYDRLIAALTDDNLSQYIQHIKTGKQVPISLQSDYLVYSYPVQFPNNTKALLVIVQEHDLLLTHKSALKYALLVLFLGAVLTALLTIYLLIRRFTQPYQRLLHGLEKTSGGELYYLIEASGEEEVRRLAKAFNALSKSLLADQKKFEEYDIHLHEAHMSLQESQQLLKTVIDSSPVAVVTTDLENRIVVFNRKATEFFGCTAEYAIGEVFDEFFTTPLPQVTGNSIPDEQSGFEVLGKRNDGSVFPAYVIASPVTNEEEALLAHVFLIRDISESKSFQEMLIRLDRYYRRGEMAGDIAHEINNYLSILMGNIELMPMLLKSGKQDKALERLKTMRTTVDKIAKFSDGLIDNNPDDVSFEQVNINQVVENVLAFLKPQNRFDKINIETHLTTGIPLVELDVGLIQQVLVDIIYNAADALEAIEGDKRIIVKTDISTDDDIKQVQVTVKDNGPGIPEEFTEALFTKRFTTKRKGHGIGLITCRKIMDLHQGTIRYQYDNGAEFVIAIPVIKRIAMEYTEAQAATV